MNRTKRQRASKLRAQRALRPVIAGRRAVARKAYTWLRDGMFGMAGLGTIAAPSLVDFNTIPMTRADYNAAMLTGRPKWVRLTPGEVVSGSVVVFRGKRQWRDPAPRLVPPLPVTLPLETQAKVNEVVAEIDAINARGFGFLVMPKGVRP